MWMGCWELQRALVRAQFGIAEGVRAQLELQRVSGLSLGLHRVSVRAQLGTQQVQLLPARGAPGAGLESELAMSGYRVGAGGSTGLCPGAQGVPRVPGRGGAPGQGKVPLCVPEQGEGSVHESHRPGHCFQCIAYT